MNATKVQVIKLDTDNEATLHCQYPRQYQAQGVFFELDIKTGQFLAAYDPEIGGGVPVGVWHGLQRRWHLIRTITASAANTLMDELTPLAQRVLDGSECIWDGNNFVGRMNDDAQEAFEEITSKTQDVSSDDAVVVWDAFDWYEAMGSHEHVAKHLGILASTSDEQLDVIEASERAVASADGIHYVESLSRFLRQVRDELIDSEV